MKDWLLKGVDAEAVKAYREEHNVSLAGAKKALIAKNIKQRIIDLRRFPHRMAKRGEVADVLEILLNKDEYL